VGYLSDYTEVLQSVIVEMSAEAETSGEWQISGEGKKLMGYLAEDYYFLVRRANSLFKSWYENLYRTVL
jgi:hypothetical protein